MALHPVFVHFHTGIGAATAVMALLNIVFRLVFRDGIRTPGTRMAKLFHEFDIFIHWGNIITLLGLIVGMWSGFVDWPMVALLNDPYMRFKILWSVIATLIYIFVIILRTRLGDRVWDKTSGFLTYGIAIAVAGVLMIIIAAMGGIAVYGDSILKPVLDWIGLPWP
ncbi:MAG: hypothetical protein ACW975_03430 [Candidatus Thorarchaeota archaeon]|jgi:hypothetical protein